MGGGTGTGAAPVVAEVARDLGALTVGVVTKPFFFEGKRRLGAAENGIQALSDVVDSIITIPNDRLLQLAAKKASFTEMLKKADEVLYFATKGIADLITVHGLINLDFADVKAVMSNSGLALMGTGFASGEGRAKEAARMAITSPLLEDVSIEGAKGVLMNITCSPDMLIEEAAEAANIISSEADEDAQIFFGTVFDPDAGDEMRITVIATGIEQAASKAERAQSKQSLTLVSGKQVAEPAAGNGKRRVHRSVLGQNRNVPAYLRYRDGGDDEIIEEAPKRVSRRAAMAGPGEEHFVFDQDELDIPAFIRKNSD
jgi:cell division protein FtsZ